MITLLSFPTVHFSEGVGRWQKNTTCCSELSYGMRVFCTCVWFYWTLDKQGIKNVEVRVYDGALGRFSSRYDKLFKPTENNILDCKHLVMWFKQQPTWIWLKWLFISVLFPVQFSDVILYTSRGMTPTNQFKVHGQLPLHGMTVSSASLSSTRSASNRLSPVCHYCKWAASNSWTAPSFNVYPLTHTHTHIEDYTCPSPSLPFHHLSLSVYFGRCCPRFCRSLMFFLCLRVLLPDQREWRWVGSASRLHAGRRAAVGGGGSKVRSVAVSARDALYLDLKWI